MRKTNRNKVLTAFALTTGIGFFSPSCNKENHDSPKKSEVILVESRADERISDDSCNISKYIDNLFPNGRIAEESEYAAVLFTAENCINCPALDEIWSGSDRKKGLEEIFGFQRRLTLLKERSRTMEVPESLAELSDIKQWPTVRIYKKEKGVWKETKNQPDLAKDELGYYLMGVSGEAPEINLDEHIVRYRFDEGFLVDAIHFGNLRIDQIHPVNGKEFEIAWNLRNKDQFAFAMMYDKTKASSGLGLAGNRNRLEFERERAWQRRIESKERPLVILTANGYVSDLTKFVDFMRDNKYKYEKALRDKWGEVLETINYPSLETMIKNIENRGMKSITPEELDGLLYYVREIGDVPSELERQAVLYSSSISHLDAPEKIKNWWSGIVQDWEKDFNGTSQTYNFSSSRTQELDRAIEKFMASHPNTEINYRAWPSDDFLEKLAEKLGVGRRTLIEWKASRDYAISLEQSLAVASITLLYADTPREIFDSVVAEHRENVVVYYRQGLFPNGSPQEVQIGPVEAFARESKRDVGIVILMPRDYSSNGMSNSASLDANEPYNSSVQWAVNGGLPNGGTYRTFVIDGGRIDPEKMMSAPSLEVLRGWFK